MGTEIRDRSAIVWAIGLLGIVFLLGLFPMSNADIWWHLRTGEVIWDHRTIPQTDWFTYTNPESIWVDLHWGFQILVAGIWNLFGESGLVITKAVCGVLAFALCLTASKPSWRTAVIWALPVMLFADRYLVRPEMLTYIFLSATLAVLHHAEHRPRLIWWLPAISFAWVNTHSLFCLQFVVVGLYLVCYRGMDRLLSSPENSTSPIPLKTWCFCLAAMLAASLINPYGYRGLLFPLELLEKVQADDRLFFQRFSGELVGFDLLAETYGWLSLIDDWRFPAAVLLVFAVIITSGLLWFWDRRLVVYRVLLLSGFVYLAWRMNRNISLFALVAGFVLSANASELAEQSRSSQRKGRGLKFRTLVSVVMALGIYGGFAWYVLTGRYYNLSGKIPPRTVGVSTPAWRGQPALDFLNQPGMPARIYALNEKLAAQCIYNLGPDRKVFADARLELNTRQTLQHYWDIRFLLADQNPAAQRLLAGPDAGPLPALVLDNLLIVDYSVRHPELLQGLLSHPNWRCVFSTASDALASPKGEDFLDGVTIFLPTKKAEELKLKEAPLTQFSKFVDLCRQNVGAR